MTNAVQATTARISGTSLTITLSSPVTPGNTLVLGFYSASAPTGVTESHGATVNTRAARGGGNVTQLALYDVLDAPGGTTSFTIQQTTSGSLTAWVAEYPKSEAAVFDQVSAIATGTSNSTSNVLSNTLTPAVSNELAVCFCVPHNNNSPGLTWTAPFVSEGATSSSSGTAPSVAASDAILATPSATAAAGTIAVSEQWSAVLILYKPLPVQLTSVNGGSPLAEGASGIALVGTGFAAGMTATITQPNGVSVTQTVTYVSPTSATFTPAMEPGSGAQLAFTDATYTTQMTVTAGGQTSPAVAITLTPPSGVTAQTLTTPNPTSSYRITASPDLVASDQLEIAGDVTGVSPAPTGLTINSDATWQFASGDTPVNFYVRVYDSSSDTWSSWALQTVAQTVTITVPTNLIHALQQFFSLLPG